MWGVGFSVLQGRHSEHSFTRVSCLSNYCSYIAQKFHSRDILCDTTGSMGQKGSGSPPDSHICVCRMARGQSWGSPKQQVW